MIILRPRNVMFERFWPLSKFHFPVCSTLIISSINFCGCICSKASDNNVLEGEPVMTQLFWTNTTTWISTRYNKSQRYIINIFTPRNSLFTTCFLLVGMTDSLRVPGRQLTAKRSFNFSFNPWDY